MLHEDITEKIIQAFYKVYNTLGYGSLEKVYENAVAIELRKMGFKVEQQKRIKVYYEGQEVGNYESDLVVENLVIVETKAKESLREEHEAQLVNYLRAPKKEVGLVLNFGKKPEFRRKIFANDLKNF
ncbi:MAG: GxxExxY protein [candidate division KSB1 bacterium]|nr:GxxExxY protein [candidate division KSB1 bacterium]MDZ7303951.1 GxxExxY protein [candidate division KSB1 bacterium]MDZ7313112.1 GxxExxY protein [candidate division KSB1 bacterium]